MDVRVITLAAAFKQKDVSPGKLMQRVRVLVHRVRENNPELVGYELYDVGFTRRGEHVDVNLYFRSK